MSFAGFASSGTWRLGASGTDNKYGFNSSLDEFHSGAGRSARTRSRACAPATRHPAHRANGRRALWPAPEPQTPKTVGARAAATALLRRATIGGVVSLVELRCLLKRRQARRHGAKEEWDANFITAARYQVVERDPKRRPRHRKPRLHSALGHRPDHTDVILSREAACLFWS